MIEVQHITQTLRPRHRRGRRQLSRRAGRDPRLSRPERRRQNHDDADPDRLHAGHRRPRDGRRVTTSSTHPIEAKRRTGYLPETPPLYPDMTVREYLDFVARIKGVPSAERQQRVATVMERTHVADMADRHCGKLSKGYRQRVGLAQALIHNPDVLILDEPTAGLDPSRSSRRATSSAAWRATTRSSSARTSCRRSRRPASGSSSSTTAGLSRSIRPTT